MDNLNKNAVPRLDPGAPDVDGMLKSESTTNEKNTSMEFEKFWNMSAGENRTPREELAIFKRAISMSDKDIAEGVRKQIANEIIKRNSVTTPVSKHSEFGAYVNASDDELRKCWELMNQIKDTSKTAGPKFPMADEGWSDAEAKRIATENQRLEAEWQAEHGHTSVTKGTNEYGAIDDMEKHQIRNTPFSDNAVPLPMDKPLASDLMTPVYNQLHSQAKEIISMRKDIHSYQDNIEKLKWELQNAHKPTFNIERLSAQLDRVLAMNNNGADLANGRPIIDAVAHNQRYMNERPDIFGEEFDGRAVKTQQVPTPKQPQPVTILSIQEQSNKYLNGNWPLLEQIENLLMGLGKSNIILGPVAVESSEKDTSLVTGRLLHDQEAILHQQYRLVNILTHLQQVL